MAKLTVISACYGEYDDPHPPVEQFGMFGFDIDYVMVTDGPQWDGWRTVVEPRPHLHPNLAAKLPKVRPDLYTDADFSIWVDAGSHFGPDLAQRVLSRAADDGYLFTLFKGTHRSSISDELIVSRGIRKYDPLQLEAQVRSYLASGYPDDELWGTGVIGRSHNPITLQFGDAWMREMVRWGFQDQISFAYLRWARCLFPSDLGPPDGHQSDVITFANHGDKEW